MLEIAQDDDAISKVTRINRGNHLSPNHAALRDDHKRRDTTIVQIAQKLVQLGGEVIALGHRIQVTVQAVDDDDARLVLLHGFPNDTRKLSRRDLDGIDFSYHDLPGCGPLS